MKRITITLEDGVVKHIQKLRAEHLIETNTDVSFSKMVNECLKEYFKSLLEEQLKEDELVKENIEKEENDTDITNENNDENKQDQNDKEK